MFYINGTQCQINIHASTTGEGQKNGGGFRWRPTGFSNYGTYQYASFFSQIFGSICDYPCLYEKSSNYITKTNVTTSINSNNYFCLTSTSTRSYTYSTISLIYISGNENDHTISISSSCVRWGSTCLLNNNIIFKNDTNSTKITNTYVKKLLLRYLNYFGINYIGFNMYNRTDQTSTSQINNYNTRTYTSWSNHNITLSFYGNMQLILNGKQEWRDNYYGQSGSTMNNTTIEVDRTYYCDNNKIYFHPYINM